MQFHSNGEEPGNRFARNDEDEIKNTCSDKATPDQTGIIDSKRLFEGRNEVLIHHAGEVYRLRVTRNGRLILNK